MATSATFNPFPGLRPFDTSLSHLFFGREQQVEWLLDLLRRRHFLTVLGPSGSGKSSLVRAGVVPTLQAGGDGETWEVVLCKPGQHLLDSVSTALEQVGAQDVRARTLEQAGGLTAAIAEAGFGSGRNALLVVDQFEELFRLQEDDDDAAGAAARCVEALLYAVQQREVPIYVVFTMRAEFLGHCTLYPGLAEAINEADYLVPRMTSAQLRAAIERPVDTAGAQISTDLVERLLDDVGGDEDQLPVLQHAMMRTWEHWEDTGASEPLALEHYEAVGTVDCALSKHAEEMYAALPEGDARHAAELIFKTLAGDMESGGGRHPTPLNELVEIAGVEERAVTQAAEQFRQPGCWFITPSVDTPLAGDTVLDIAHESLVRLWNRAQQWSGEEQASSHLYQRLASTAALYQEGRAGLYQDPDLELALDWRERSRPTASWARRYDPSFERAMTFLEHSRKERDFQIERREEEQRRKLQRTRRLAVLMGGVSMVFLAMMVFALDLYFEAEENRKVAIEQREVAQEERRNAERQQQIAVEQREVAEEERRKAERQQQIAVEQREVAETERQNAERQQQIAVEQKRNADRLRLLSVARSLAIQATQVQPRDEQRQLVALLALQAFRFNQRYGGSPLESDIYNALQVANEEFAGGAHDVLRAHSAGVRAVTFAPDGNQLVSGGEDGAVYLWDISPHPDSGQSARLLLQRDGSGIRHVRFAGSGQLAVGATSGRVWRWDGALDKAPQPLMGTPPKAIGALDYAPAGRLLAAGVDGWLSGWDIDQIEAQPLASNAALGRLHGLAASTEYLVAAGDSGHIWVWDLMGEQQEPQRVEMGKTSVRCLAFSPDGSRLVAGTQGGDLLVWQNGDWQAEPQQLIGHISAITGLAFNGAGDLLASSSLDRSVRLWSVDEGASIAIAQDDWVWDVAFSPDDNRLASAGADRTVRLWYADVRDLARTVATRVERDMTEAEWKNFVGEDIPYEVTRESPLGGAQ